MYITMMNQAIKSGISIIRFFLIFNCSRFD